MAKNIIVLSDGTGNAAASLWRTNVWRTFQALDLSGNAQVARYDDGVGSSSFLPLALIGGAFGYGLKRNVIDLYKFICRNYVEGDQIYAFGFSRGAFTVRVLAGLITKQGLVRPGTEEELNHLALDAYRAYRKEGYRTISRIEVPLRWLRDQAIRRYRLLLGQRTYVSDDNHHPRIAFIGVWDTVSAYGLPIDEMTRGVSRWLWPLELPDRVLSSKVDRACHALALDDERTTFHPLLWTEPNEAKDGASSLGDRHISQERISQVWFLGMHANVGGGYPDDALAHIPLAWMLDQVSGQLKFKAPPFAQYDEVKQLATIADKDGRMYDSRSGLGLVYRYGPRRLWDLCHVQSSDPREAVVVERPKIHCSVFERMAGRSSGYAPLGLPETYDVVTPTGQILGSGAHSYETTAQASARARLQEAAWNFVWFGRWIYFLLLGTLIYLVGFHWFNSRGGENEFRSPVRLISEVVRSAEALLPTGARWWADWYAANPVKLAFVLLLIVALVAIGGYLRGAASAHMRSTWQVTPSRTTSSSLTGWHARVLEVRTSKLYVGTTWFLKRQLFPLAFAIALVWLAVGWTSHLLFNVFDSMGAFCRERQGPLQTLNYDNAVSKTFRFATKDPCARTGVALEANQRYSISFEVVQPWKDWWIPLDPLGREAAEAPSLVDQFLWRLGSPLRRVFFRGWFHPIARVGATGNAEYFLDPYRRATAYVGELKTERSGELFLYVNDAVLPLPWVYNVFYRLNEGVALVKVTRHCDVNCKERTLTQRKEQCRKRCPQVHPQSLPKVQSDRSDWASCYLQCVEDAVAK